MAAAAAAVAAAAAAYMVYEAQAVQCRLADLPVPNLPRPWYGTTLLHLSDVHAGLFPTSERSLRKAVRWAITQRPDLVILTGDILGDPGRSRACLQLLQRLRPPLGMFAVAGNHEYGLGKGPLARARDVSTLWKEAGVVLLRDTCHLLPPRDRTTLALCGADYLTGGLDLHPPTPGGAVDARGGVDAGIEVDAGIDTVFPILLVHEPPPSDSPLASRFALAFAGHTHGGQLRVPGRAGPRPLYEETASGLHSLSGVLEWGQGSLVVSRGLGTSFLPFRLMTRPEATIWRLV